MPRQIDITTAYVTSTGYIQFGVYTNGRTAIQFNTELGELILTATVNLPDATLEEDEVFIKIWGSHEGLLQCLERNGVVKDTGRRQPTGFVEAAIVKLLWEPEADERIG